MTPQTPSAEDIEDTVDKDMQDAFEEMHKEEEEQRKKDHAVLDEVKKMVSKEIFEHIENEIKDVDDAYNFRITNAPEGDLQNKEPIKVWAEQWETGCSGDSWAGTVSVELPNSKYLTWSFQC